VNKLKRHLSVANVLSCIALFVALSATAVAATKLAPGQVKAVNIATGAVTNPKLKNLGVTSSKIANGTIVTGKLKNGAVTNGKLKNGAVTNAKLGNAAVTAKKLGKNSVTTNAIGLEQVTAGKIGGESISAAKMSASLYKQLLKNVTYVTETSVNDSATEKSITALCPVGKEAIGGGARINSPVSVEVANTANYPLVTATNSRAGWIATGRETAAEAGNWQVVSYAICAEL
jgi:hypothetical protein